MMMKIKWIIVNELSDGHGVLFIHNAVDKAVAFLVGYYWLHGAPCNVNVEILNNNYISIEDLSVDIKKIVDETKNTIRLFIKNKGIKEDSSIDGQVRAWWNA